MSYSTGLVLYEASSRKCFDLLINRLHNGSGSARLCKWWILAKQVTYFVLCLMLSVTYYAQKYAGTISWSLECIGCLAGHFYKDVGYKYYNS